MEPELSKLEKPPVSAYSPIALIFIASLVLRFIYVFQVKSTPIFFGPDMDADPFDLFACQIMAGNPVPQGFSFLNLFYPLFLAAIYIAFGHNPFIVLIFQAILGSLNGILIYFIGKKLFSRKVGLLAAFVFAFYGPAIFFTGIRLAPTIILFLSSLLVLLLLSVSEEMDSWYSFFSGMFAGILALARPNVMLFIICVPVWIFLARKARVSTRKATGAVLLGMAGFFFAIMPLTLHNYRTENRFSPFPNQGGINFYLGNNENATGFSMNLPGVANRPLEHIRSSLILAEKETGKKLTPSQASQFFMKKGFSFLVSNPEKAFFLYIKKIALFWIDLEVPSNIDYTFCRKVISVLKIPLFSFGIVAPLGIIGIFLAGIKKRKDRQLPVIFICMYMLSVILFFINDSYRIPVVPFLIVFSAYGFFRFLEILKNGNTGKKVALLIVLVALFVGIRSNFFMHPAPVGEATWNNLGRVYINMGRLDEAESALKKALKIRPDYEQALYNLGLVYQKLGDLEKAEAFFLKAVSLNPNVGDTYFNLGLVYQKRNQPDKAIWAFQRSVANNPHDYEALYRLATLFREKGDNVTAMGYLKKAREIAPGGNKTERKIQ